MSLFFLLDGLFGIGHKVGLVILVAVCSLVLLISIRKTRFLQSTAIIGLVFISIAFGTVITEAFIRLCLMKSVIPEDETAFNKQIASTWPHEIPVNKQKGTFRILGVGDSFGVIGFEKNYQWILETLLKETGLPFEMISFSACGYDPRDELTLVQRFASQYHPDLILHGIYLGNDLEYVKVDAERVLVFNKSFLRFSGFHIFRPWCFLSFRLVRRQVQAIPGAVVRLYEGVNNQPAAISSEEEFCQRELKNLNNCKKGAPEQLNWKEMLGYIHQMQDEAHNMGAEYAMLLHPDQCQIDTKMFESIMNRYGLNKDNFDLDLPQRYLVEDCRQRGTPYLDLTPFFRQKGSQGGLYNFRDIHWNDAGNRLAAEQVKDFLISTGFVKTSVK